MSTPATLDVGARVMHTPTHVEGVIVGHSPRNMRDVAPWRVKLDNGWKILTNSDKLIPIGEPT
jgi:hypothetical protein